MVEDLYEIATPVTINLRQPYLRDCVILPATIMQNKELRAHIEGCRQGDSKSQRWIFERYYRLMFGVCLRYVSDRDAVQDVVQEGFLKVFTNIEGYTFKGSFEGWVRRIMVNTSIDAIRRRKATGLVLGDEKSFEEVSDEGDFPIDHDDEVTYTVHDVQDAMSELSPMYRAVFNLYVFDNLTHQEISAQLGINVGTSKSNLAKARRNLRKLLMKNKTGDV
jgi:RNA polymerase sigma factor (sigma-70 family)